MTEENSAMHNSMIANPKKIKKTSNILEDITEDDADNKVLHNSDIQSFNMMSDNEEGVKLNSDIPINSSVKRLSSRNSSRKSNRRRSSPDYPRPNENIIKAELLNKINVLKARGKIPHDKCDFDINTPLSIIESHFNYYSKKAEMGKAVNTYRMGLMFIINMLEMGSNKFDVMGIDLSGWSQKVDNDQENLDEIFQDLFEKYGGAGGEMAPEMRLLFALIGSAVSVQISNTMIKTMGGKPSSGDINPISNIMSSMFGGGSKKTAKPVKSPPDSPIQTKKKSQIDDILNSINNEL